eukprot:2662981-Rhodomonas_salina.1
MTTANSTIGSQWTDSLVEHFVWRNLSFRLEVKRQNDSTRQRPCHALSWLVKSTTRCFHNVRCRRAWQRTKPAGCEKRTLERFAGSCGTAEPGSSKCEAQRTLVPV